MNSQFVKAVDIPYQIPPKQRKVARILQTIDQAIEKTEALIEKYQQIKAGLMHDLFTRGIGADGQLRPPREQAPELYQQTPIGWIPKEWKIWRLDELTARIGDGIHTTPVYSSDSEFYFINGNNLENGLIRIGRSTLCVDKKEYLKHYIPLDENTILYSINGTIGNIALYQNELVILGKSAAYIKCSGNVHTKFIFHFLQSEYVKRFYVKEMTGSTISNLSLTAIRATPVYAPLQNSEQQLVVDRLDSIETKIIYEQKKLKKLKKQKSGLMHDLLTGKVQVNTNQPEAAHG